MPGMIKNIIKNFVKKSVTRPYPIEVRPGFQGARGELSNQISRCTLCGLCAKKCPSQCIRVDRKARTWACDVSACVLCGICEEVCPAKCLSHYQMHRKPGRKHVTIDLKKDKPPECPAAH